MSGIHAIRLENLSKSFGWRPKKRVHAVQNVSLEVAPGQVYGFLGPNGAGKTTAIRIMLDLMRPNKGTAYIYGQSPRKQPAVLRRVGMLVEGPAFYPYLTGRKNLIVISRAHGCYDPARIDALLEQVNLAGRGGMRFKNYSLGMKQRLGLAAALIHDPDLLILDEPTNGLDPAGIQEMRLFIRDLVDNHGKTVFLSSHMLSEVEQVCDRVAIINKGEIVHEGAVSEVQGMAAGGDTPRVMLRVNPHEAALRLLQGRYTITQDDKDDTLTAEIAYSEVPGIVAELVANNIEIHEVVRVRRTLEDFFLSVTNDPTQGHINGRVSEQAEVIAQ